MKTELFKAIKRIDPKKFNSDDLQELLNFFMVTRNGLIRNYLSLMFADLHYDKAVPYIIKKIKEKKVSHNNGTLVYSLGSFDMKKYFVELIKIICSHEYEPRLMAYELVDKIVPSIQKGVKNKAMNILEEYRVKLEETAGDKGENSKLHFVEKTQMLLQASNNLKQRP